MNAAMNMMPMQGMMPMMPSMPMMMNGMNPMMMNGMGMMPMMMCSMSCTMTKDGMVCEMKPMAGMSQEMFMECCKSMTKMMSMGMPMMCGCGPMMMMCMPAAA